MSIILKRLSISIPKELELDLDRLKKEQFYKEPQSEMLRHLLRLGIQANKEQLEKNDLGEN